MRRWNRCAASPASRCFAIARAALLGLLEGGGVFWNQLWTTCVVAIYSFVASYIIVKIAAALTGGARVSDDDEERGLDTTQHGEEAYTSELA